MKFSVLIKKLKNPRVRRRLKIALSVYGVAIVLGVLFKMTYDVGYFNALALENEKNANLHVIKQPSPVLKMEAAQRIVSGALKEDPAQPKTIVVQIIDSNSKLSSIIIENNKIKKVAWIIDMRLFFTGDLLNEEGYNLTKGVERQHNINNAGY
jgi:hypothetical protein